jgi:hypothetical protein
MIIKKLHIVKDVVDEMKLSIHLSHHPSIRLVIHPWHGGNNHVAIDLIVQHIRKKLGQHDFRKIYPNVYVIQSTFQVCSYFVYIKCSNNVQRQTTCEAKLQINKVFLGSK